MRRIISEEKRRQIIAALNDNPNATQIAREVGCVNYRTIVRLAEGAGIELTAGKAARGHPRVSPEKHAQIIAALKDNPNAIQVARKIGGVSHTKVGKIAKAAGITLAAAESGKRLSAEQRAQIIGALKDNPNASEVAKQIVGVSQVAVWKIAKAAGIELTRGKAARDMRYQGDTRVHRARQFRPRKQSGGSGTADR
jgi:transposase-like protein